MVRAMIAIIKLFLIHAILVKHLFATFVKSCLFSSTKNDSFMYLFYLPNYLFLVKEYSNIYLLFKMFFKNIYVFVVTSMLSEVNNDVPITLC